MKNFLILCAMTMAMNLVMYAVALMLFGTAAAILVAAVFFLVGIGLVASEWMRPGVFESKDKPLEIKRAKVMLDAPHYVSPESLIDPRGDGSLQPGDPLFEMMKQASQLAEQGKAVTGVARWNEETEDWDLAIVDEHGSRLTTEEMAEVVEKWE